MVHLILLLKGLVKTLSLLNTIISIDIVDFSFFLKFTTRFLLAHLVIIVLKMIFQSSYNVTNVVSIVIDFVFRYESWMESH